MDRSYAVDNKLGTMNREVAQNAKKRKEKGLNNSKFYGLIAVPSTQVSHPIAKALIVTHKSGGNNQMVENRSNNQAASPELIPFWSFIAAIIDAESSCFYLPPRAFHPISTTRKMWVTLRPKGRGFSRLFGEIS